LDRCDNEQYEHLEKKTAFSHSYFFYLIDKIGLPIGRNQIQNDQNNILSRSIDKIGLPIGRNQIQNDQNNILSRSI